jgi:hypothetical protein
MRRPAKCRQAGKDMLEMIEKWYSLILTESANPSFLALAIFALWVPVGCVIHELGHLAAARLCGIKGGRLVFQPMNGKRGLPFPGLLIDENQLLAISRVARRFVFAGGAIADILTFLIMCGLLPMLEIADKVWVGVLGGVTFRGLVFWVNLIPLSRLRSDGWRMLNPDSRI